jgi:hypothetical protein
MAGTITAKRFAIARRLGLELLCRRERSDATREHAEAATGAPLVDR